MISPPWIVEVSRDGGLWITSCFPNRDARFNLSRALFHMRANHEAEVRRRQEAPQDISSDSATSLTYRVRNIETDQIIIA